VITEIAIINIKPGQDADFAASYRDEAHEVLVTTPGCVSARMLHSEETPTRFVGVVEWESKKHHLENFCGTNRWGRYAAILAPYVAAAPVAEPFDDVMDS
jgi:heme-degrading monooxygenase HmoA